MKVFQYYQTKAKYAVFQCTKYPTSLDEIGLNVLSEMKGRYQVPIGLSDHSGSTSSAYSAIAKNADILEFHITFNKKMFGPDTQSSLDFDQLKQVVKFRDDHFKIESNPVDKDKMAKELRTMRKLFNKSLVLTKSLRKGSIIKKEDLTAKKPGSGIPVQKIDKCIGKKVISDLVSGHILSWEDMRAKMYVFLINPARVGHLDVVLPIILQLKKDQPDIHLQIAYFDRDQYEILLKNKFLNQIVKNTGEAKLLKSLGKRINFQKTLFNYSTYTIHRQNDNF